MTIRYGLLGPFPKSFLQTHGPPHQALPHQGTFEEQLAHLQVLTVDSDVKNIPGAVPRSGLTSIPLDVYVSPYTAEDI